MREEEIKNQLVGKKVAVVSDTDGEGVMLGSAVLQMLLTIGVDESDIAVVSHFASGAELATTARGNVVGTLNALRGLGIKYLFLLDVPPTSPQFIEALAALTHEGTKVIIIDHIMHGYHKYLQQLQRSANRERLERHLTLSTPQKFLSIMQITPMAEIYKKAVMATVLESDFKALPELSDLRALVPDEEREGLPIPTLEYVMQIYPQIVAFDTYLKFGKFQNVKTGVTLIGNTAPKVAYFAQVSMETAVEHALQQYAPPDISDSIRVDGFVAIVDWVAPKGQGFKIAALGARNAKEPFVIALAEGFEPDVSIVIIAPNNFLLDESELAATIIRENAREIHEMLMQKGMSRPQDFPRGDRAVAVGVVKGKEQEAIREIAKFINAKYAQAAVEKAAARVAVDILSMVIADKPLMAAMAKAFEEAMRRIVAACRK